MMPGLAGFFVSIARIYTLDHKKGTKKAVIHSI